jgi:uncharacterized protein (DUF1501 family)
MTVMTRRDLFRSTAATALIGALPAMGVANLAFAGPGADPNILIVLHLRGGCDGLNLISPSNDSFFVSARATDLRVSDSGQNAGYGLANGPDPQIDFRLHPSCAGLAEIYRQKQLAFVHAAGVTNEMRSHFVATDMIQRGVAEPAALGRVGTGWFARYLNAAGTSTLCSAMSMAGTMSGEFVGHASALSTPDLDHGFGVPGGPQTVAVLERLYGSAAGPVGDTGRRTLAAMAAINQRLPHDPTGKVQAYAPDAAVGTGYDGAGELGRGLKGVAELIKADIGLTAASVELGGWDMHENQPGRFKANADKFSRAVAAFWNDMAPYHDRLTLVTLTEFGRRLRSNRSNGTDHGRGSVIAVLGGRVGGGRFYGAWPGTSDDKLDEGVDLAVVTDYRLILSELLEVHGGRPVGRDIFPGYREAARLGLVKPVMAG